MNIGVLVFFWTMFFSRCISKSGIARSHDSSAFSFLSNLHTALHNGCTNLHSHQLCRRVPFFPHCLQYLLSADFLVMSILTDVNSLFFPLGPWLTLDLVCTLQGWFLFPSVLWNSCDQTLLAFKSDYLRLLPLITKSLDWEDWYGAQDLHSCGRTSVIYLFSRLWVAHFIRYGLSFNFFFFFGQDMWRVGSLVPWAGTKPMSPATEAWSLNLWTAREVPGIRFDCSCAPPTVSLWLLLCFWMLGIFFCRFQCLFLFVHFFFLFGWWFWAVSHDFNVFIRRVKFMFFYLSILPASPQNVVHFYTRK